MQEPTKGTDYTERDTEAVMSVLIELAQILGAQSGKFVLVGGSVPGILFKEAKPEHIGTFDIDIELNPEALGEYGYVDMVRALENSGYKRNVAGLRSFQLLRTVPMKEGDDIDVVVDLLMPMNANVKQKEETIIDGLKILRIDGGDVGINHSVVRRISGNMPDGIHNEVDILVASIPALLVMKGYAIGDRKKEKDAYDIWFSIRNYESGIEALAEECRQILEEPGVRKGYEFIAQKFKQVNTYGPQTVRKFLEERSDQQNEMTLDQIQNDAFFTVNKWCELVGLLEE